MQTLEAALRRRDPDAHIYFAPKSIKAGTFWLPSLANEIAEATVFVLLIGEKGVGPWQVLEYNEALSRRAKEPAFPLVPVVLDGQPAPGLPFLRQLHWIVTADPVSENSLALLMDAADGGGTTPKELWRYTAPYRGLAAMTEADSDYFFGRARETAEVMRTLAGMPDKLPILLGNSGVGKSSLAQAGAIAALMRQGWPETAKAPGDWPQVFDASRRWCFLKLKPGTEPVRALVEPFLWTWQFEAVDPKRAKLLSSWVDELLEGKVTLRDLLDATQARYQDELHQPAPPAFLLYIDQGEELYVRGEERERRRFSEILARDLGDPRLHALMSLRADFSGALQRDQPLFDVYHRIEVPPLREAQLCEVVSHPAELLSARFETDHLATDIARRTADESTKDAGALPLLSYLLDDMWSAMVARGDGVLRMPPAAMELGGVLAERANAFLERNPHSKDALRRVLTLKLATVREDGEPTRRRAGRSEFSDEEWRLVSNLADHPNRLLVTATSELGETYAEVAHEAIFRRWEKLRDWITAEREFLVWRTSLEADCRRWENAAKESKDDALLTGLALAQAQSWILKREEDLPKTAREFAIRSGVIDSKRREAARLIEIQRIKAEEELARLRAEREAREQRERADAEERARREAELAALRERMRAQKLRLYVGTGMLLVGTLTGVVLSNQAYIKARAIMLAEALWPPVLTTQQESALKLGDRFKECADCPEMVVIPAGEFMMGAPPTEEGRYDAESPQHKVTIARAFAVSRFEVTFAEWDACVTLRACGYIPPDENWGRGSRPVVNVSWNESQQYVEWLSWRTGKPYRLLSGAEWEYAARGGTQTRYFWGDAVGNGLADCNGCGSQWDFKQTAPAGSFAPNAFGLYDMHGNVWEWVEDCNQDNYNDAPVDGSPRTTGNCGKRVVRGGSWFDFPRGIRAAVRNSNPTVIRFNILGFRVARTLTP